MFLEMFEERWTFWRYSKHKVRAFIERSSVNKECVIRSAGTFSSALENSMRVSHKTLFDSMGLRDRWSKKLWAVTSSNMYRQVARTRWQFRPRIFQSWRADLYKLMNRNLLGKRPHSFKIRWLLMNASHIQSIGFWLCSFIKQAEDTTSYLWQTMSSNLDCGKMIFGIVCSHINCYLPAT